VHDSPNADQTSAEYWEGQVACLCGWGNGYSEKKYSGPRLVAIEPLRPDLTKVFRDASGARKYSINDRGKNEILPEDKIFHLRGFGFGGDVGLSPISYARQTMGTSLAADETAAKTFENGLQLSGFVKEAPGTKSTQTQREELLTLFAKFMGSSKAGKVMPLPAGFEFQGLTMNPEDAQLLQTRAFHVEEICRWYRVPPFMVGHSEKSTSWGTGLEQQMIGFLTFSLRPYLTRIEQAVRKQLIAPADRGRLFGEFTLDGLLRADSAGRAALLSALGQNGYMTRNEGRALDNRKPMPGGDVLTVQSNLIPLDQLGKAPPKAVQPAPGDPVA
jgi:HK97 family phage portal protein